MARKIKRTPRGFTLIELVIVVAVIAILAALLVPTILGQAERARVTRARADVNEIGKAAARMRADTDATDADCYTIENMRMAEPPGTSHPCAPANNIQLPHCVGQGSRPGELCWGGPYLPRASGTSVGTYNDPWNSPYQIRYDEDAGSAGRQGAILVWSYGLNKTDDTNAILDPTNGIFDCSHTEAGATNQADDICAVF